MASGRPTTPILSYRDLTAWQKAMDLVVLTYGVAEQLAHTEMFALASQMRRSAVSVPANVAEGHGRFYRRDYVRILSIANGSLMELETELTAAHRLRYITEKRLSQFLVRSSEVARLLAGLRRSLERGGFRQARSTMASNA